MKYCIALISLAALVYVVSCSPKLRVPEQPVPEKDLSDIALSEIYTGALKDCYEYMFSKQGGSLDIHGKGYGKYTAGIKGMILYTNLKNSVSRYLSSKSGVAPFRASGDFYSLKEIESLAGGIPAFRSGSQFEAFGKWTDGKQDFNRYNPAMVSWGITNLIPSPGTNIAGIRAQEIYNGIFSRFFRMMALSHSYLEKNNYNKECRLYGEQLGMKSFDGLRYLEQRYSGKLPEYDKAENFSSMTGPMAIGFWLRRRMDGTDAELWNGLNKLLQTYDTQWYIKQVPGGKQG